MKERSLLERVIAILGVLFGTVVWVVRLLFSVVRDVVKTVSGGGSTTQQGESASAGGGITDRAKDLAAEAREKGETVVAAAREKSETVVSTAREKVEDLKERATGQGGEGDEDSTDESGGEQAKSTSGIGSTGTGVGPTGIGTDATATEQHGDLGGVVETMGTGSVAAANLSAMGTVYDERDTEPLGGDEGDAEALPAAEQTDTPGDVYGSESAAFDTGEDERAGYAGQVISESDSGEAREDLISGFADSPDVPADEGMTLASDEVELPDLEDIEAGTVSDEETTPAASRGWQEPEDTVLADDPLYGDFESSGAGGEVDLQNDELDEDDGAGMHIVTSPDEPYIEDEDASLSAGLVDTGTEAPFDTTLDEEREIDDVTNLEPGILHEDDLVADALGNRAGGDAASGDLGAAQSPDDATWDAGESRPDYDVLADESAPGGTQDTGLQGAYDGSGVDEFASDAVAEDMLDDVSAGTTEDSTRFGGAGASEQGGSATGVDETDQQDDSGSTGTASVAWASSAGVIDTDLTKPLPADELESSGTSQAASEADVSDGQSEDAPGSGTAVYEDFTVKGSDREAVQTPRYEPQDASLRDVAADVADQLGDEIDRDGTSGYSTNYDSGPSTPESLSVDASGQEVLGDEDTGVTGGTAGDTGSGDAGTSGSAGTTGVTTAGVAGTSRTPDVEPSGSVGGTTTPAKRERGGGRVPAGAVRGDGSGVCPSDYPIKGNANSRIYHRPTDSSYDSTIPEFCFATEQAAKDAGYRARKGR